MKRYHRQIIHIFGMLPYAILAYYLDNGVSRSVFLFCSFLFFIGIFGIEIFRLKKQHLYENFMNKIAHIYKKHEQNRLLSTVWSPVVLLLLGLFFSKFTILTTICVGGFSDSLAAMIGMRYGGKKNKSGKTWLGTFVYFFFTLLFVLLSAFLLHLTLNIFFIIILAFITAFLERYCISHQNFFLDDDFIVPMVFALLMEVGMKFLGV